ncbi:hypothetical protein BBD40_13580 [Paenibacillus ihbetae]|uniref:Uncharacterized protein n=1 Tax=Paenibacillus ihbetae TaxID=1870820 RepID=A0ABX3K042_9BACL|nr:hypothetical protein BBD40_13580 [Paenibacillus ihbetae]
MLNSRRTDRNAIRIRSADQAHRTAASAKLNPAAVEAQRNNRINGAGGIGLEKRSVPLYPRILTMEMG